ncbi:hypothetical protein N7481_000182 [Penicillium waksmanii]|uniref:uncharacterized protein n=1 Tax=Penicillium waksmanii TaxID=69791 RepID=UPI0025466DDC|nr:uncharacterized protein N7481_000182 [Penicillium waksmanii]KAJ5999773.1 hypothetical protein N7481_000182 [Penicillium waksmanii]
MEIPNKLEQMPSSEGHTASEAKLVASRLGWALTPRELEEAIGVELLGTAAGRLASSDIRDGVRPSRGTDEEKRIGHGESMEERS